MVSLGGGTFTQPQIREKLLARGPVVALWASPETIYERVQRRPGKRPLLAENDPLDKIKQLLKEREAVYRQAHVHVTSEGRSPKETAAEIVEKLWALKRSR